jgi:hypothetical protein
MNMSLKERSSWGQLKAVERASERVNSWPEWKRTAINYRVQSSKEQPVISQTGTEQKK